MGFHKALAVALGLAVVAGAGGVQAQTTPVAQGRPVVIGQSYALESKILGETRRFNVRLPAGYDAAKGTYRVLYLLDGGEREDFPHIAGLMQLCGLVGTCEEMIVVGIEGTDRRRDMTYPSKDPEDLKMAPTSGGSERFRRFIAEELQPLVTARYGAGKSTLMGESLAGLFVVETFLRTPGLFDDYIAISPSVWWDRNSLTDGASALLAAQPAGERRLYLTIADEGREMQTGVDDLVAALKAKTPAGLTWTYAPMSGETHATIYHPAALAAFRKLYAPPPEAK
ncbi:alpha/beta hydrolase [Caulobacter mirabilis]|uniref:Esterase n=1 Tax=Caulobacter mirabilis TaxID=69666 RepID=A0A2D2B2M2_9CAUL|nr:alpha/beta hydrolase-fold protein [Caulobacter mirabilis]ATQ44503.1 esterase [Caulobacter mirabilis]